MTARSIGLVLAGFVLGVAAVAAPPMLSRQIAMVESRAIYDCGIRIASDVTFKVLDGAVISNHDVGICIDGPFEARWPRWPEADGTTIKRAMIDLKGTR